MEFKSAFRVSLLITVLLGGSWVLFSYARNFIKMAEDAVVQDLFQNIVEPAAHSMVSNRFSRLLGYRPRRDSSPRPPKSYIDHKAWLGFPVGYRWYSLVFQVLAAIGFLLTVYLCYDKPPKAGLLSDSWFVFPALMLAFLAASGAWAFFATSRNSDASIILEFSCLFIAAGASVFILGGLAEDNLSENGYLRVVAWSVLCITTVLHDGVAYSARLIRGTRL